VTTDLDFTVRTNADGRELDRIGITDATYIYGAAVDILGNSPVPANGEDRALREAATTLARCLAADAQLRLFLAGPEGPSQPLGAGGPEGAAVAIRAYFKAYGYVGTQHCVGNVRIAFTGADSAVSTSQIPCYHWLTDERMLLAPVRYRDEFGRQEGVWRIAKRDIFAMRFWVARGYAPDPLDPCLSETQ
jgi:hypothetical protein